MNKTEFPIVVDGMCFFAPLAVAAVVLYFFSLAWIGLIFAAAALYVLWFFRNPDRKIPSEADLLVSPADGRILKIEEVEGEVGLFPGRFKKVSIFMNIFNVHVNRAPCAGIIQRISYRAGKFFSANLDKASVYNERNAVVVRTDDGRDILVIQIAGLVARRIVCWKNEGMRLERGERFGLIRFGSRLEVFTPVDTEILVSVGDKVQAGATAIGRLS